MPEGVAVRVTLAPALTAALQVAPHEMGPPLTVPTPKPLVTTLRVYVEGPKVAVTVWDWVAVTVQVGLVP